VRVSKLRQALRGSGVELSVVPGGYRLMLGPDGLDVARFARLVEAARAASGEERLSLLEEATGIRRGAPLAEFVYDDFARPLITADEEQRRQVVDLRGETLIELGRPQSALAELSAEFDRHPDREGTARMLMRALGLCGETGRALDVFKRLQASLAERGLEPSPQTCEVEEAVL